MANTTTAATKILFWATEPTSDGQVWWPVTECPTETTLMVEQYSNGQDLYLLTEAMEGWVRHLYSGTLSECMGVASAYLSGTTHPTLCTG